MSLTFNHILTAVRFVYGDDVQGGTVKSVSLKNVYSQGTYNMGTGQWSLIDTPATFSQTLNKTTAGTKGEVLSTDAQTFMMLPQTLPEGAELEIVFTDNSHSSHHLTANIGGTEWPRGGTVTYEISTSSINWDYTFHLYGPLNFTYMGGTQQYGIISYRQHVNGKKEPVKWVAEFSTDGGASWTTNRPDWVTEFTATGNGGETKQVFNATVSPQTVTDVSIHTSILQTAQPKGRENSPYNLANQSSGGEADENTANCYVVSAPGYYSFPLVYGNAIKNSTTNESAYKTNNTGEHILSTFINHTGNPITSPYIKMNADCTPAKAELLWQDAKNLVTDIKYNNIGNGNISFAVNKATIKQGNAVIVIKDDTDKVLWSWHIWVTDEDINNTIEVENHQKIKYKLMPVNLGWCGFMGDKYEERSCLVRFSASGYNQTKLMINQSAYFGPGVSAASPYYQWGRKDPRHSSTSLKENNRYYFKTYYDKDGNPKKDYKLEMLFFNPPQDIVNNILYPNRNHYLDLNNNRIIREEKDKYMNLWSTNLDSYIDLYDENSIANDEVIKTIYDPCPVGFKVPTINLFTGFFKKEGVYGYSSEAMRGELNGELSEYEEVRGFLLYTDASKTTQNFFPEVGIVDYFGTINVFTPGICWAAERSKNEKSGRCFHYYRISDTWKSFQRVSDCMPVRPCEE